MIICSISALDNDSESLKLFYMNPNGSEWDYGDWQGTVKMQQTFLNHTWVIRSEKTGECIEWFRFVNNYAIDPSMAPFPNISISGYINQELGGNDMNTIGNFGVQSINRMGINQAVYILASDIGTCNLDTIGKLTLTGSGECIVSVNIASVLATGDDYAHEQGVAKILTFIIP